MLTIFKSRSGFTIIELMVALTVLTLLTLFAGQVYLNYTSTSRDLQAGNLVYEEGRFLMERIVREIRQNAVDYEQYFNQNIQSVLLSDSAYTDNYCSYHSFFYDSGPDGDPATFQDNESRGSRNADLEDEISNTHNLDPAAVRPVEAELYLINLGGNKRTILTRAGKNVNGETLGKVGLLRMIGKDFGNDHLNGRDSYNGLLPNDSSCFPDERENDGFIDSWECDPDFPCKKNQITISTSDPACEGYTHVISNDPLNPNYSFVDISPDAINVVDLRFIIRPQDDPWKAYNMNEIQIQPHVTIQLTIEANPTLVDISNEKHVPSITLTSTVSARNYDEVKSECR